MHVPQVHRAAVLAALVALSVAGCSASAVTTSKSATDGPVSTTTTTTTAQLPGTGKPELVIGDKNFTEQFILGELYDEALSAEGYSVELNSNIGTTSVTYAALQDGQLDLYPEYLGTWDYVVAHHRGAFRTAAEAYAAGQEFAGNHSLVLLNPTPFSDTPAIAVTDAYAQVHDLRSIAGLRKVAASLTMGGPPQFEQSDPGLPSIEQAYGFAPAGYTSLDIGAQYSALDSGSIQAADVNTTDGELASGDYRLLSDPRNVFGWGQAVPVVSAKALSTEGPELAETINRVDALLTTTTMRWLNAQVDVAHRDPAGVAREFLETHGLIAPGS